MRRIKISFAHEWVYPKFVRLFDDWVLMVGPLTIFWPAKPDAPITVHYWKAIRFHGGGTLTTPKPMNEEEALVWVARFGNVAYIDRECGFIFYKPKE